MFNEFYKCLTSFPEDKFVTSDKLSQSVINSLRDPVCLNIPNIMCKDAPAECKKCSQVICAKCVEMILKSDAKCPNCRDYLQVRKMNRYLRQILSTMKMRCHLHANGCSVALPLEELIKHEDQCEFECVQCPKNCGKRVIRKYSEDHIENECPLGHVKCFYRGCSVVLSRDQLRKHLNDCPFRLQTDSVRTTVSDEEGKEYESAEITLCFDSDSDYSERMSEGNISEKEWKLSFVNLVGKAIGSEGQISKCSNEGCTTTTIYAELIRNHEKICCYKIEPCINKKYGCTYSGNQYGLLSHQLKCQFAKPGPEGMEEKQTAGGGETSTINLKSNSTVTPEGTNNLSLSPLTKKDSC